MSSTEQIVADIVFLNGAIITMNANQTITEAIAIKDNKICSVRSTVKIRDYIGEKTRIINLKGKSLLPGFIDGHIHLSVYGANLLDVSCNSSEIKSLENLFNRLRNEVKNTKKGNWVRVWSFNENNVTEKRFPTREELDEISTEHPILIVRVCNHLSIVNSKALNLANIDEKTENPEGGIIEKDTSGQLTGRLIEMPICKCQN